MSSTFRLFPFRQTPLLCFQHSSQSGLLSSDLNLTMNNPPDPSLDHDALTSSPLHLPFRNRFLARGVYSGGHGLFGESPRTWFPPLTHPSEMGPPLITSRSNVTKAMAILLGHLIPAPHSFPHGLATSPLKTLLCESHEAYSHLPLLAFPSFGRFPSLCPFCL